MGHFVPDRIAEGTPASWHLPPFSPRISSSDIKKIKAYAADPKCANVAGILHIVFLSLCLPVCLSVSVYLHKSVIFSLSVSLS